MTEEMVETLESAEPATPPSPVRPSLLPLVKVIAFVSVVVIVQIAVAAMLAPSAEQTERLAEQFVAASHGQSTAADDAHLVNPRGGDAKNIREVKLGTYTITRFNPATNTTRAIDFELFGTVLAQDLAEFERQFENSHARLREQVIMIVHGMDSADLTEAGLGLLKRRILEKTNAALGQPLIREVLFSKFNFVER